MQINPIQCREIFVANFTSVLLAMHANHMSSVARVIFELFATNVARESLDITVSKEVLFQAIRCEESFATKFTNVLTTCLILVMLAPFVSGQRGQGGCAIHTLITGIRLFTSMNSFMLGQAGFGGHISTTIFARKLEMK